MPIKNYSTQVGVQQTVAEIHALLASKGARAIRVDYGTNNEPSGIAFIMLLNKFPVEFQLPVNVAGVERAMKTEKKNFISASMKAQIEKRSKWVAWRIVKDWVAAQLAIVESNQIEMGQAFLSYAIAPGTNRTAWQQFQELSASSAKQLTAGAE